ncbi:MAG: hypothetical protein ACOCQD_04985, partial [archaeon]
HNSGRFLSLIKLINILNLGLEQFSEVDEEFAANVEEMMRNNYQFMQKCILSLAGDDEKQNFVSLDELREHNKSVRIFLDITKFEKRIRKFIADQLKNHFGNSDYENKLLETFKSETRDIIQNNRKRDMSFYPHRQKSDIINYLTIMQYYQVIKNYWDEVFEPILKSKTKLKLNFEIINECRNKVNHSNMPDDSLKIQFDGSITWFKQILGL